MNVFVVAEPSEFAILAARLDCIERRFHPGIAIVRWDGPTHRLRRRIGPTQSPVLIAPLLDDWLLA